MDKDELKRQVEVLRYHRDLQRMTLSESLKELIEFIEQNSQDDGLVVAVDKKKNPWAENRKCAIL